MFYVYEWYIENTNEIIYVGKGSNKRYLSKQHNKLFKEFIKRFKCKSRIIEYFEDEQKAYEKEFDRINELKSINQCVCNIVKGGNGGGASMNTNMNRWTINEREKYSKNNVMKSKKQRERMSKNNPMKNKEISKIVGEQHTRKVIIDGKLFNSVKDVCLFYNITPSTVKNWCKKGINSFNQQCRYEDEQQQIYGGKRYNKGSCKSLIYKNKEYESPLDLAQEINISKYTVYRWCKKGFDDNGISCRYKDDIRKLAYKKYISGEQNKKPIKVNGIIYQSKADAEKTLGIKRGGLVPYIQGKRKNKKYICEYVNQQPSTNLKG